MDAREVEGLLFLFLLLVTISSIIVIITVVITITIIIIIIMMVPTSFISFNEDSRVEDEGSRISNDTFYGDVGA